MQTLSIAFRTLGRRPRTSALAFALLALGIALPTAIYSVVDGVWLRGLPFPDGDRIATVTMAAGYDRPMPSADFLDLRERQSTFAEVAAFRTFNSVVTQEDAGSKGLTATYVTGNLFQMLGARPILGRSFTLEDEEPSAPLVVILSHRVWQTQLGADPKVLGRTVELNRERMTVVGVMGEGFHFPVRQEAWSVLRWQGRPWSESPVFGIGKLPPGTSPRQAELQLQALVAQLEAERPLDGARQVHVRGYVDALLAPEVRESLRLMLWAVLGVLLVACANAANLRLVDALDRERETTVRRALGATGGQLLRQLLTETCVLVTAGSLAGIAGAALLVRLASTSLLRGSPLLRQFWIDVRLDARSCLFAAGMAGVAVVLGGLVPALWTLRRKTLRLDIRTTGTPSALRLARTIVTLEVAVCFALVVASGLLARSGWKLLSQEPAFDTAHLMRVIVTTYQAERNDEESRRALWDELLPRLAAIPEVEKVTLATGVPWLGAPWHPVRVASDADVKDLPRVEVVKVLPGYFETLRLPLRSGRLLAPGDAKAAELSVVVSASFAGRHFGGEALSHTFEILPAWGDEAPRRARVAGIVADRGLGRSDIPGSEEAVYAPLSFAETGGGFLIVRGRTTTAGLIREIDRVVASVDPRVATLDDRTYEGERAEQLWVQRRLAELFSFFAATSLLLAAAGLFGVISLSVKRRSKEMAVRSALGARPRDLRGLLLREGMRTVVAGLVLGGGLVYAANRFVQAFLYEVEPWDPTMTAGAALCVTAVLLAAVSGPARRAERTDPATILRSE